MPIHRILYVSHTWYQIAEKTKAKQKDISNSLVNFGSGLMFLFSLIQTPVNPPMVQPSQAIVIEMYVRLPCQQAPMNNTIAIVKKNMALYRKLIFIVKGLLYPVKRQSLSVSCVLQ